jgi:hypothetical protein
MTEPNPTVAIVVDPVFGERLLSLADQMPVWIADTPVNRSGAELFWSNVGQRRSVVTTFRVNGNDVADWCRTILPQVDIHHGDYSQSPAYSAVEVFGATATPLLRAVFSEYGFTISSERSDGFRAIR